MSILELARIVTTPRNLEDLDRVRQLHAIKREMLLGRLKRNALMRLAELTTEAPAASADEVRACEVMRKACVDILRSGNDVMKKEDQSSRPRPKDKHRHSLTPASETEILETLEKWGEKREEEEVYPQIDDSPGRIAQIDQGAQMGRGGIKSGEENQYESRARASGAVELAGWSKAEPQAMSGGRDGVEGVEVTDNVQVGMAFGKTSDHGTRSSRAPLETQSSIDPGSRNGPDESGGCASGSFSHPTRNPPQQPRPPPSHPP